VLKKGGTFFVWKLIQQAVQGESGFAKLAVQTLISLSCIDEPMRTKSQHGKRSRKLYSETIIQVEEPHSIRQTVFQSYLNKGLTLAILALAHKSQFNVPALVKNLTFEEREVLRDQIATKGSKDLSDITKEDINVSSESKPGLSTLLDELSLDPLLEALAV
jgi:hypothetical protein